MSGLTTKQWSEKPPRYAKTTNIYFVPVRALRWMLVCHRFWTDKAGATDIRGVVARHTTNEVTMLTIPSRDSVEVSTATLESFTLRRTPNGLEVNNTRQF